MRNLNISRILRLLSPTVCVFALLCAGAFAADVAVEDVPVLGEAAPAPQRAALIEVVPQAETEKPEVRSATVECTDGLLQAGGFLKLAETPGTAALQSSDALYPEAKAALVAGLRARQEEIGIEGLGVPIADILAVYQNVVNDHPEFFFVDNGFSYNHTDTEVISLIPKYKESYTEANSELFETVVDEIVAKLEPDWTDLQKLLFLHDYLVTHCEYENLAPGQTEYTKFSAYDALIDRVAVCQGYALAYCYLTRRAGLNVDVVTSDALEHAWNAIYLDGERFYVDCTWDDPSNGWYEGHCSHENFMLSRDLFYNGIRSLNAHNSTDWICGMEACFDAPSSARYDSAWWLDKITAIAMIGNICAYSDSMLDDVNWEAPVYLRDWNTGEEQKLLLPIDVFWPDWNEPEFCWPLTYYAFVAKDGVFRFNTHDGIWKLTVDGTLTPEYALNDDELQLGYLYGIVEDGGALYYSIGTAPNGVPFTRKWLESGGHTHVYESRPGKDPGCTEPGWNPYRVCTICGASDYVEIPAPGHALTHVDEQTPTCTTDGWTAYDYCTRCGYMTEVQTFEALGHDYNYMVTQEPGCETPGVVTGTCTRCTDVCYIEVEALGHLTESLEALAPTCTEPGHTAGVRCTRCAYSTVTEIAALGHAYEEGSRIDATCEAAGSVTYVCTHDTTHTYTEELPALGHDYVGGVLLAPTCESTGTMFYVCKHDSTHTYSAEIPALGHNYVGGVVTQPGCETTGLKFFVCSHDTSHTYSEEIPALGHAYVLTDSQPATNDAAGWETYVCSRCNDGYTKVLPKLSGLPGDVSGDGSVNAKDVTTLRRVLAGGFNITFIESATDINHDGAVNAKDVTTLRRALAGGYGIVLS